MLMKFLICFYSQDAEVVPFALQYVVQAYVKDCNAIFIEFISIMNLSKMYL